jgi:hypothetical protein
MDSESSSSAQSSYFPVSPYKFTALSVLTFGLYELFWHWKNWRFIRARDGSNILPWGRALFAPFWYPALLNDLKRTSKEHSIFRFSVVPLAIAYFVLLYSSGAPDPFWLISLVSFLPLLPAVREINRRNFSSSAEYARNSAWKLRHTITAIIVLPLMTSVVASAAMIIPSNEVVSGLLFWGPGRSFLERKILEPGEEIVYFYCDALFSFQADGNLLTDRRAVSYWQDDGTGELVLESARFDDIDFIELEPTDWPDPVNVVIYRSDGSSFNLWLPRGDEGTRFFVNALQKGVGPRDGGSGQSGSID